MATPTVDFQFSEAGVHLPAIARIDGQGQNRGGMGSKTMTGRHRAIVKVRSMDRANALNNCKELQSQYSHKPRQMRTISNKI